MARPKRKKIEFTEESLNDFMQEVYEDAHNIRAKIVRLWTKWEAKVKDSGDIAGIGDAIIKLINAEAKNQDQKIMILKYLKDIVYADTNSNKGKSKNDEEDDNISVKEKSELLKWVREETTKQ